MRCEAGCHAFCGCQDAGREFSVTFVLTCTESQPFSLSVLGRCLHAWSGMPAVLGCRSTMHAMAYTAIGKRSTLLVRRMRISGLCTLPGKCRSCKEDGSALVVHVSASQTHFDALSHL